MKLLLLLVLSIITFIQSKNKQANGVSVKASIKGTKETIAQQIFDLVYKETGIKMSSGYTIRTVEDGYFFTAANTMVCAAFYHHTKKHSATADGGFCGGGVIQQVSDKKYWAVACSSNGIWGRKTYYNVYN